MRASSVLYWGRVCLGVISAGLCTFFGTIWNVMLIDGLFITVIFYIGTNFILRRYFTTKGEEASNVFSTGIGAYFMIWLVTWVLFFSLLHPEGLL